jgi:predicted RNA binding protein YcfA (HicA-like mRNA interferase family)
MIIVSYRRRPLGVVKVRDIIRELNDAGWYQVRQTGSHRIIRHHDRGGSVVVPGALGVELSKGTMASIVRQAGLERRPR